MFDEFLLQCYISVLKSILREEDAAGTQFGPPVSRFCYCLPSFYVVLLYLHFVTLSETCGVVKHLHKSFFID